MANPSDKGARGPAGPLAEPLKPDGGPPTAAPSVVSSGVSAQPPLPTSGAGGRASSPGMPSGSSSTASASDRSPRSTGASASQSSASLGAGLKETGQTAAEAVRQQAAQFAEDIGHELSKTGEAQKARGVEAIRHVARAIDSAAGELEGQSPQIARTVHEAARRVDGLSDTLSNRNVNDLIDSATRLARAQPALFFGGSIAAGFALARFLKSSSRQRPSGVYDSGQGATGYDPYQH